MTTEETMSTLARTMRREAQETNRLPWVLGQGMVRADLEERLVDGLRAFAHLWFLELTDETELPKEFHALTDLIEQHYLANLVDLEDEEDEEEGDNDW